jgi:hypothetical protein
MGAAEVFNVCGWILFGLSIPYTTWMWIEAVSEVLTLRAETTQLRGQVKDLNDRLHDRITSLRYGDQQLTMWPPQYVKDMPLGPEGVRIEVDTLTGGYRLAEDQKE